MMWGGAGAEQDRARARARAPCALSGREHWGEAGGTKSHITQGLEDHGTDSEFLPKLTATY